ncbi:MAG: redoxin domain-containing protein [Candidatus Omnitrophica bacterium]|nr:redoxin domain-containing protein [Candidatus Omnitrophota bacterium]
MDKFFSWLVFLTLFILSSPSALAMGNLSEHATKSLLIGKAAPDIVLTKTDGTSASVIGSRQGQKAILVFWATWCPHCYEDLSGINDSFDSIEKKGIKIILVDIAETKEDVKNYFLRRQMKLVSFVDEDSALQEPYHLIGVPTLIFIDKKGVIRSVTHDFPSHYEDFFS